MSSFKDFIYFPSFSSAGIAPELKQDFRFNNGTPCRFYSKDMGDLRYPYFLISAGANYRNMNARKDFGLTDDVLVVGDSGGFQIKTGNLKWKPELKETILRWLENNCDIAMNLDIPPGGKVFTDYNECLKMSVENFEYFSNKSAAPIISLEESPAAAIFIIHGKNFIRSLRLLTKSFVLVISFALATISFAVDPGANFKAEPCNQSNIFLKSNR